MRNIISSLLLAAIAAAATDQPSFAPGKTLGGANAPIKLEVFSDYQCPSCKALYEETLRPLMAEYVVRGKIYFIHRDFPLTMHAHARLAATYANAAARVNKYEPVCAQLFRTQSSWAASGKVDEAVAGVLSPEEMKKVRALIPDKKIAAEIEQDLALGNQANVTQTPTMIVTHKGRAYPIPGVVSYPILRRFLDDLLSK